MLQRKVVDGAYCYFLNGAQLRKGERVEVQLADGQWMRCAVDATDVPNRFEKLQMEEGRNPFAAPTASEEGRVSEVRELYVEAIRNDIKTLGRCSLAFRKNMKIRRGADLQANEGLMTRSSNPALERRVVGDAFHCYLDGAELLKGEPIEIELATGQWIRGVVDWVDADLKQLDEVAAKLTQAVTTSPFASERHPEWIKKAVFTVPELTLFVTAMSEDETQTISTLLSFSVGTSCRRVAESTPH